jgi:glyceraldehyde-3-phosphate dehydrogenase type I
VIDDHRIRVLARRDPAALPWAELDADVVIESTGKFRTRADAMRHLEAGAPKVILSAPAKGPQAADANIVLGVNFDEVYDPARHHTVANASCTTNCLAPVAKACTTVGIRYGLMTTIHACTADQSLLDGPHKGPAARPARRPQPRADLDGSRQGARTRHSRARLNGYRRARACADGLARRPHDRGGAPDQRGRGQRPVR